MKTIKFALIAALTISGILAPQTASASDRVSPSGAVSAATAHPSDDPAKADTSDATVRGGSESANRPQEVFIGLVEAHDAHLSGGDVSGHVTWELLSGTSRKLQVKATLRAQTSWFSYSTMASSRRKSVLAWRWTWQSCGGSLKVQSAKKTLNGTRSEKSMLRGSRNLMAVLSAKLFPGSAAFEKH